MDQIALRVTLTLLKNLNRKQIRPQANMVDRTKEQRIMNIDPYVRVTKLVTYVFTLFTYPVHGVIQYPQFTKWTIIRVDFKKLTSSDDWDEKLYFSVR